MPHSGRTDAGATRIESSEGSRSPRGQQPELSGLGTADSRSDKGFALRTYQVQEAAKVLGIAPSTVYDLARQRKIAHRRIGTGKGRIVFTEEDIEEFLNSCKVDALSLPAEGPCGL